MSSTARLHMGLASCVAANAHDAEALCAIAHPDVSLLAVPGVVPGAGYEGHEGLRRSFSDAAEARLSFRVELVRAEIAGECVLAAGELEYRVNGTHDRIPVWIVYRFTDDLVSAIETYLDEDRAREMVAR